jgi:hypothetical protein
MYTPFAFLYYTGLKAEKGEATVTQWLETQALLVQEIKALREQLTNRGPGELQRISASLLRAHVRGCCFMQAGHTVSVQPERTVLSCAPSCVAEMVTESCAHTLLSFPTQARGLTKWRHR